MPDTIPNEENILGQALSTPGLTPPKRYYNSRELDQRPRPLSNVIPKFPEGTNGIEVVVLRLLISENGELDDAQVLTAGLDTRLARNAVQAFSEARFAPGIHQGSPVPSTMLVEVVYDPNDLSENGEKMSN